MAALGIPTTRSLAAVLTGESVMRDRVFPGGVLTRVASSHLRVGTVQYFAARGDVDSLVFWRTSRRSALPGQRVSESIQAFYDAVVAALARLTARWMVG